MNNSIRELSGCSKNSPATLQPGRPTVPLAVLLLQLLVMHLTTYAALAQEPPRYFDSAGGRAGGSAAGSAAGSADATALLEDELTQRGSGNGDSAASRLVLPESRATNSLSKLRGVMVGPESFEVAKPLIVLELQPLVKAGALAMDSISKLPFVWRLDDDWERVSRAADRYKIGKESELTDTQDAAPFLDQGYPFGAPELIEQAAIKLDAIAKDGESGDVIKEALSLEDPGKQNAQAPKTATVSSENQPCDAATPDCKIATTELGIRALWNSASLSWKFPYSRSKFTLTRYASLSGVERPGSVPVGPKGPVNLKGSVRRVYPRALTESTDTTGQLFREIISIEEPQALANWRMMTFRFLKDIEDVVWFRSPALQKNRQLAGSNRSDPILRSEVAPNDLLGWSGKLEWVAPRFDKIVVALTPFAYPDLVEVRSLTYRNSAATTDASAQSAAVAGEAEPPPTDPTEQGPADQPKEEAPQGTPEQAAELESVSCFKLDNSLPLQRGKFNTESFKFPRAPAWVPSQVVYTPRKLLRLELTPDDAHSLFGREIMYVEIASMLPVYRIVYDRRGSLRKVIISPIGLATDSTRKQKIPFISLSIIFDLIADSVSIIDYTETEWCKAIPADDALANFDPRRP